MQPYRHTHRDVCRDRERLVLETLEICPDLYLNFELRTYVVNNLPRLGPEIKSLE